MKAYVVQATVTGQAWACIEADDKDEAKAIFVESVEQFDFEGWKNGYMTSFRDFEVAGSIEIEIDDEDG